MYILIKTVTRNGLMVSQESSEYIYDWNTAKEAYFAAIAQRQAENKRSKKKVQYQGNGMFVTANGFHAVYSLHLVTKVDPEAETSAESY